jgi:transcriptional regulator with XRE-family HTH domain
MPGNAATPVGDDFAEWVRARRIALMVTQEQLAERAGLCVRTVRNIELGRGGRRLRLETRRRVIAALTADAPGVRTPPGTGEAEELISIYVHNRTRNEFWAVSLSPATSAAVTPGEFPATGEAPH